MTGLSEGTQAAYGAAMDKKTFLAWVQRQDGRYELANGRVVMQARVTRGHSRVANEFVASLRARLDPDKWEPHTESFGVDVGDSIRYPDVMVEGLSFASSEMTTDEPVLLVEVLSPSSEETDLIEKAHEYQSMASLQIYIVASQDEPKCWIWQRDTKTMAFPAAPIMVSGRASAISVLFFGIDLPLGEIYRNIGKTA